MRGVEDEGGAYDDEEAGTSGESRGWGQPGGGGRGKEGRGKRVQAVRGVEDEGPMMMRRRLVHLVSQGVKGAACPLYGVSRCVCMTGMEDQAA